MLLMLIPYHKPHVQYELPIHGQFYSGALQVRSMSELLRVF